MGEERTIAPDPALPDLLSELVGITELRIPMQRAT
jgi:hypothetical protein